MTELPVKLIEKYGDVLRVLGKGSYGVVLETSKGFAVKITDSIFRHESVMIEYSVMNLIQSPHIMNLIDIETTSDHVYMVMPLGKVLADIVDPSEVKETFIQMCYGVADLHLADMSHQDLKPKNFIRVGDKVLLTDFDYVKFHIGADLSQKYLGFSLWWEPPENRSGIDSPQAGDIWALGVILLSWLIQEQPFVKDKESEDRTEFLINIFRTLGFPTEETWPEISTLIGYHMLKSLELPSETTFLQDRISDPIARDLVEKMLNLNPAKRPTIYEVLAHPYFDLEMPERYLNPHKYSEFLRERMLPIQNSNKLYTIPPPYLRNLIHKEFLVRVFSYALNIFNFMLKDLSSNQLHLTLGGCIYIGSRLYNNDDNDLELLAGSNHTPDDLKQKVIEINQVLKHNVIISHPYVFARAQVQIHGDLHLIPLVDQLMLIFLCSSVSQTYSPEVLGLNVYELARTFKSKSPRTPLQFKMIVELWSDVIASERSSYSLSQFYRDLGIFSIYTDLIA